MPATAEQTHQDSSSVRTGARGGVNDDAVNLALVAVDLVCEDLAVSSTAVRRVQEAGGRVA